MPAYAYPIQINENPKIIIDTICINLGYDYETRTSFDKLKTYGITDNDEFHVVIEDGEYRLYIYKKRLETPEEVATRVAKEKQYMDNYNKFNSK